MRDNLADRRQAVDEYLAHLAEKQKQPGVNHAARFTPEDYDINWQEYRDTGSSSTGDTGTDRYSLTRRTRQTIDNWLRKCPDITDEQRNIPARSRKVVRNRKSPPTRLVPSPSANLHMRIHQVHDYSQPPVWQNLNQPHQRYRCRVSIAFASASSPRPLGLAFTSFSPTPPPRC